MTFADAAEKVGHGDSGHLQLAIIDLGMVPAERLHSKAAYSRYRTIRDIRGAELVTPKLSVFHTPGHPKDGEQHWADKLSKAGNWPPVQQNGTTRSNVCCPWCAKAMQRTTAIAPKSSSVP